MNESKDNLSEHENAIEQQVNQALDASVENLSTDVRRSLNQIRLAASETKKPWPMLVPLAGSIALTLTVFIGWQFNSQPIFEETPFAEVLQEDLEMLDDLEFVFWMNEEVDSAKL